MADERLRSIGDVEKAYKAINDEFEKSKKLVKELAAETDNLKSAQKELLDVAKSYKDVLKSSSDPKTIAALRDQQVMQQKVDETLKKHITTTKELEAAEKKLQSERVKELQLQKQREKAIDDFTKKELAAAKAKEKARLDELKLQRDREKAFDDYAKKELQLQKQRERAQKVIDDEANAYKKLTRETNKASDEFVRLAAQHGLNSKEAIQAKANFDRLDKSLREINNEARRGQRDVGRYGLAWKQAQSALGAVGVTIGVGFAAREGLQVLVEYEDAVAKFRTIVSDLSDKDFSKYQTAITNVADTTKLSTTEIASSFETIAGLNASFAESPEGISKVSEAVATLAKASKGELQPTAENLVGIMNQFDLAANQADRTINVLAAGQAVGAASIAQSSEAYKNFGSVAKGANIDLEKSQALIQTVAKFSIFGAEAGTKLRGVTLKLQQANLGYQSGIFNINDALKEYNEKIAAKTTAQDKDALASEVFGAENITVGKILANNVPLIEKFEKGVTGTSEAQKAAAINANTLSNRWEEFEDALVTAATTNENVGGSLNALKNGLKFVAENLGTIVSVLGQAIKAFITFKTVMFALKMSERISEWRSFNKAVKENAQSTGEAASGAKRFGQALKGIGLTALIASIWELGNAWLNAANKAQFYADVQSRVAAAETKQGEKAQGRVDAREKEFQDRINFLKLQRSEGKITEEQEIALTKKATEARKKQSKSDVEAVEKRRNAALRELEAAKKVQKALDDQSGSSMVRGSTGLGVGVADSVIKKIDDRVAKARANVEGLGKMLEVYRLEGGSLNQSIVDLTISQNEFNQSTDEGTESTGDLNNELKERESLLRQIEDAENDLIKDELERAKNRLDIEVSRSLEDLENSTAFESEKARRKELIIAQYIRDINQLEEDARKAREERDKAELERLGNLPLPPIAIPEAEDFGLGIEEETAAKRLELLKDMSKSSDDIETESRDFRISLLEREIGLRKELGLEIYDFELELAELQRQKQKELLDKQAEDRKKWLEAGKRALDELAKATNEYAEGRVDSQQKIIDSEQKLLETIQNSAEKGTLEQSQSIAKQEEKIAAAQAKKIQLEKEKQAIEFATAAITTFTKSLEGGATVPQAFADVALSQAGLKLILDQLPKFFGGTKWKLGQENTAVNSGRDGHLIWADKDEAIINPSYMKKAEDAGINSVDDLVNNSIKYMEFQKKPSIGMDGYIQMMMHPQISTPVFDDDRMVRKLDSIESTMKKHTKILQNLKFPESNVGKIVAQAMTIIDTDSRGNTVETVVRKPRNNNFGRSQA